jgi:hypothetical protein
MANIKYTIQEEIVTLSVNNKGWKKQLNLVSWNDTKPKFDIRTWDETQTKMGKGVTLSEDEVRKLYLALRAYFGEDQSVDKPRLPSIEQRFEELQMKAPLFIQELKNILGYMDEQNLSFDDKKALLTQSSNAPDIPSVLNEIESIESIYRELYCEYLTLLGESSDENVTILLEL